MATTPPGWYDDGRGALRWWDGLQWTEHVQTPDAEVDFETDVFAADADAAEIAARDQVPASENAPTAQAVAEETVPASAGPAAYAAAPGPDELSAAQTPDAQAPASVPPGYPGGFPGGSQPTGGFISATEPKKSKLWILWVVLGVVLLGIVILVAVLIPVLIGMFGSSSAAPSAADEDAAVAAVELYDEAWSTSDCDKFITATTTEYRTNLKMTDCAVFTANSDSFIASFEDYNLAVTSVESDDDEIIVETAESYLSLYADDGVTLLDEPLAYEDRYIYTIVRSDGGWAIDDLELDD